MIIGFIAFRYTKFGTYLKAIGAGEKAAMFSGIRTDRMKFLMYVLAGALTGFAAFINVIKVGSVTSSGGNQLETQILIALVLGGMPISGGAKVRFENIVVGSLTLRCTEQWTDHDGILDTDDAAHSGCRIPDILWQYSQTRIYPGNQIIIHSGELTVLVYEKNFPDVYRSKVRICSPNKIGIRNVKKWRV